MNARVPGIAGCRISRHQLLPWLLIPAVGLGGLMSCSSPSARPVRPGRSVSVETRGPSSNTELESLRGRVGEGDSVALDRLVEIASSQAEDPSVRARVLSVAAGRERELLERLLGRASHEVRDLGPLLREVAVASVRPEEGALALALIREVAVRECCLRRSLLAAALEGLADGFDRVGFIPRPMPEALKALAGLTALGDPEVASAAERVSRFFAVAP